MSDTVVAALPPVVKEKEKKKKRSKKENPEEAATKKRKRLSTSNADDTGAVVDGGDGDVAAVAQPTTKKARRASDVGVDNENASGDAVEAEADERQKKSKKKEKKDKEKKHKSDKSSKHQPSASSTAAAPAATVSSSPADANCPYQIKTISLFLSLSPKYSFNPTSTYSSLLASASLAHSSESTTHLLSLSPLHGISKHHLDPLLMTYFEPVDGVVIAYRNIRFQSPTARIINESPFAHVWVSVEMLVWRPRKGMVVEGHVNLVSKSHVGLLVNNTWNVSIPVARIPDTWTWVEPGNGGDDHGCWKNENGEKVDGDLRFEVQEVKAGGSLFLMEGSLLDREKIEKAVLPEMMKA